MKPKKIKIIQRNVPQEEFVKLLGQSPNGELVAKNFWGNSQMSYGAILTYFMRDGKLWFRSWSKEEPVLWKDRQYFDVCEVTY